MFLLGVMRTPNLMTPTSSNRQSILKKIKSLSDKNLEGPILSYYLQLKNKFRGCDAKIIAPIRFSDWVSNLVPTRKKTDEIKLCVDLKNFNKASLKDNYALPKMYHILQRVVESTRISWLDGFSGYNQILVHLDDQPKFSFTTPWGTFMYVKMSFGLMNAGATF